MADFRFQNKDDLTETISNLEEFKRDGFGELQGEKGGDVISKKVDENAPFDFGWKYKKKRIPPNRKKKVTYKDRVRTLHLRRNINNLDRIQEEKRFFVMKTKQDLDACQQRIESIQKQKVQVETEIQMEKEAHNSAAVFCLQAMHQRLCTELEHEKDLETKISSILKENEENMWHIEIEEGKFSTLRENLKEEEAKSAQLLQGQAEERLIQAKMAAVRIERNKNFRLQKAMEREKNYRLHHQKVISEARKNHKIAIKFLRTTLAKVHKKEAKEEKKSQKYMKKRMDAVITLKKHITTNRETLHKLRAWDQAKIRLIKKKEEAEKEVIAAQGGDAVKQTLQEKRSIELDIRRQLFAEEQKFRRCEIVARLLKEEAYDEKMKQRQLDLESGKRWMIKAKKFPSLKERTWDHFVDICEGRVPVLTSVVDSQKHSPKPERNRSLSVGSAEFAELINNQEEETLTEPEIMGLWTEKYKPYKVPKDEVERKPVGGTKMEQDILANTLEKLRSGIIHKQVVSGREFKGCPFYSKPDLIHFKNFHVGKTYKKKMTLINASYTINYCKLVGVEDHLKDFITIHFDPPGPMSAGISCEVLITFKPMINEDLEGNITFLAQTGSFSIPLKCTTKKCVLSLDKELIDFGTYVVGEIVSRTITLENHGALGTKFQVHTNIEKCDMAVKSPNVTDSTLYSLDDKVTEEKTTPNLVDTQSEVYCPPSLDIIPVMSPRASAGHPEEPYPEHATITIEEPPYEGVEINPGEDQTEIKLGEITTNEIGPFSSIKIPIIFTPIIPGSSEAKFQITFKNSNCSPLHFTAVGLAIIVPVWVPKPNVDLKICMYDRLYQDSVIIETRSKAALRLKFEVCKELQKHIELLPETGYIQAQSSYSVQLKFLPRHSLPEDAGEYFDKDTRVLAAPMTIRVADQKRPVIFTVHAVVTTSDLEIEPKEVDFGYCTIYEAVYTKITLINKSLLPQEFGFISIPKYVDIQPNDGFGVILPLQTLPLHVIFKPSKAKEYDFQLLCITEINREFTLSCKAIGVYPPLELSHYRVKFAATALFDMSTVTLYVINSHTSMNSLTHAVPRLGSGEIAPMGPTSFEFLLPDNAPIMIIPSVGTVLPGKKCMIEVIFKPVLSETTIKKEVVKMRNRKLGVQTAPKKEAPPKKGKIIMSAAPLKAAVRWLKPHSPHKKERHKSEKIKTNSEEYLIAKATLCRDFQKQFQKYVIPCVIASGDIKDKKETEPMNFSPYNTLYLELYCPTVAPSIIVASDNGKTVFNFGDIAVGHRGIKRITIQNICPEYLDLEFSILDPYGPFILLCPCRGLQPKESKDIAVSFSPRESNMFLETLEIITKKGTLTLSMLGKGVASTITCSIEGNVLNLGYVIVGETTTSTFKLQNSSTLPIKYAIFLESLSLMRNKEQLQLPGFVNNSERRTNIIGTQNYNGHSVFSVSPVDGVIEPGKTQDFTLTFSPDHESLYFSDMMKVVLFNKKISHQILLKGAAREHMMFVEGGDPLDVTVESLAVIASSTVDERWEDSEEIKSIILTLEYIQLDSASTPATRELQVGCIRTSQPTLKKSIDFSLDNLHLLQHKGFTVEPSRGIVERGQTKTINVSWVPTADFDPDQPLVVTTSLVLRGDVKETYRLVFIAHVVSEWILGDSLR
ncbi:cilia- and flagella-associated protein 74 [Dromiciops gliroides]|uniref:cilia- and flagella-associated protein 74 n=1 Tax=Dromiciops gliroides TaxID=33562 RepID=UPI001CC789BB|nr:cilia- and flagella-associated protein 74 [Dromiciops gliroides]